MIIMIIMTIMIMTGVVIISAIRGVTIPAPTFRPPTRTVFHLLLPFFLIFTTTVDMIPSFLCM